MAKKIIFSSFVILVILASSIYLVFDDDFKIDIQKTRTQYFFQENGSWNLAATEYVYLYDGTTKMRAKSRSKPIYWNDSEYIYVQKNATFKDNISTIQTYTFKNKGKEIEEFPFKNEFQCINCQGKIVHYEIRDILYRGITKNIKSPFNFGNNMKIEWEDSYYAKVFQQKVASDKIIIKYKPKKESESYNVILVDPILVMDYPGNNILFTNTEIEESGYIHLELDNNWMTHTDYIDHNVFNGRNGVSSSIGPKNNETLLWKYSLSGYSDFDWFAGVSIVDGYVYAVQKNSTRNFFKLDSQTGELMCSVRVGESDGTPVIHDGIAYLTTFNWSGNALLSDHLGVIAINATNCDIIWNSSSIVEFAGSVALNLDEGIVYANQYRALDNHSRLYAFNMSDGEYVWNFTSPYSISKSASSPTYLNSEVYYASHQNNNYDDYLFAINSTNGNLLWSSNNSESNKGIWDSSPVIYNEKIFISSSSSANSGASSFYLSNGTLFKNYGYDSSFDYYFGNYLTPAIKDDVMWTSIDYLVSAPPDFISSYTNNITAFYINGTIKCENSFKYGIMYGSPVIADGIVYYQQDQYIVAVNESNCDIVFTYETGGDIYSQLAVADNTLYFISDDGYLYALTNPDVPNLYDSLVAYYPFDSDDEVTAYDYTGDNDGTYSGATLGEGIYDKAAAFDGNDVIAIPNTKPALITLSQSAWFKINNVGIANRQIVMREGTGDSIMIYQGSGETNIRATAYNGADWSDISIGDINANIWYHVVNTIESNGTHVIHKLYLDGVLGAEKTTSGTVYSSIGGRIGNDGSYKTNGSIDEVMIFNTSLTQEEITSIYNNQSRRFKSSGTLELKQQTIETGNSTINISSKEFTNYGTNEVMVGEWDVLKGYNNTMDGLKVYFHADGNAVDSSEYGNNGTFNGNANADDLGVYNNSFSFDGQSDTISYSNSAINVSIKNDLTLAAWILSLPRTGYEVVFGGASDYGYWSMMDENNRYAFNLFTNYTDYWGGRRQCSITHGYNEWMYVVGTYDNDTGLMKMYKNGVLDNTCDIGVGLPIRETSSSRYIGQLDFNGSVDELMIFDRAITNVEVKELYIKGRARFEYQDSKETLTFNIFNINTSTTNVITKYLFEPKFISPIIKGNITTSYGDSCVCSNYGYDWNVDLSDYCISTSYCDLGIGKLNFYGVGNFTCDSNIKTSDFGDPGNNNIIYINNDCLLDIN